MKNFTQFMTENKTMSTTPTVDRVSDKEFKKFVKQFQWTNAEKSSLKKLYTNLEKGIKGPGSVLVYKAQHNMKFKNIEESEFSIMTAEQWKSFDHKNLEIGGVDVQNGSTHHESTYSTVLLARYNGVNEETTDGASEITEAPVKPRPKHLENRNKTTRDIIARRGQHLSPYERNREAGGTGVHPQTDKITPGGARYRWNKQEGRWLEIIEARFKTWQKGAMPRQDRATPEEIRVIAREKEMKSRRAAENKAKTYQEGTNYDQWYERNQIFKKLKKDGELQKMVQKRGDQTSAINRALKDQAEKKSPKK